MKVPAVVKNDRLEFNFPEYLKSQGIKYKLYQRYNVYEGCDTTYRLISCQKVDIFMFRLTYGHEGIDVVFFTLI